MSDEHSEQVWAELEARAQRLLEHPKDLEPREPIRHYGSLLRLWHFPAYGPQTAWTILTPGKKTPPLAGPMVRELTWHRAADHQRVFDAPVVVKPGSAEPTLRLRDAPLPAEDFERHWAQGAGLAVPLLLQSHVVGLDGEYFGLETYETSPFVRVQWWCEGPAEWRHFTDWVAVLRQHLVSLLDQSG